MHKIYNDTIWQDRDQDGFRGMGFVIKKILVHSEPTKVRGGEAHYNMIREKWDVRNLLEVKLNLLKLLPLNFTINHNTLPNAYTNWIIELTLGLFTRIFSQRLLSCTFIY